MAVKNQKGNNLKLGIQHCTLTGGREMNLSVGCTAEKFREILFSSKSWRKKIQACFLSLWLNT